MLTLTRREGETVVLLTEGLAPIRIRLSRITGRNQASISIDAPSNVSIYREELLAGNGGDAGVMEISDDVELIDLSREEFQPK